MAEASISVDQDQFICPVCLDLLKDPVTLHCGHSYCKVCINRHWDQEDQMRVYSCPQCNETFTPRPVLRRNNMLAEVVEKLKKAKLEKICTQHKKRLEIYCRTDQTYICYVCLMDEHKGHDTVSATAERAKKQSELKKQQRKLQQRLQEKLKKVEEVKQTVNTFKRSAQTAVEDSEKIFTELICSIEKKRSEVRKLIRDQEKDEVSRAEGVLEQLEQEIADLKRRDAELEQLSHTEDHIHFLQNFQSLCVSSGSEDSSSVSVHQHPSFDEVRKSLSELKDRLEKLCREEFNKITLQVTAGQIILQPEPKTRDDFLKYFCRFFLDANTAHRYLRLSENNRVVTWSGIDQGKSDHPETFKDYFQVMCKESMCGRAYWEVEWSSNERLGVDISVTYKGLSRKGLGKECWFGRNNQSWSLDCSSTLSFYHNNIKTEISESPSSRIGVYVDLREGTLSFYRVSDTMTLLHRVHTTFTQPLYAGFGLGNSSAVRLCDPR